MASNSVSNKHKKGEGKRRTETAAERSKGSVPDESQRDYGALGEVAQGARDYMERSTSHVREMTRGHETGAVIMAVAAGFGIGVLIGAALVPHRKPKTWRNRILAEGLGERIMERIESMIPEALSERIGR